MKLMKCNIHFTLLILFCFLLSACPNPFLKELLMPYFPEECDVCIVSSSATCLEEGVETRVCSKHPKHNENIRIVPPLNHSWGDLYIITPATCTGTGIGSQTCNRDNCGVQNSNQTIPALGHNLGNWTEISPAGWHNNSTNACNNGTEKRTCTNGECMNEETRSASHPCHGTQELVIVNGGVTSDNRTTLTVDNVCIPDFRSGAAVTRIDVEAFNNYSGSREANPYLTNLRIGANIDSIGSYAFYYVENLKTVTFAPNSQLTFIGNSAFEGCEKLINISPIPASVISIGENAFNWCTDLTSVIFAPNSQLTFIDRSAFDGCKSLTNFTIPNGITEILEGTFSGCKSLTNIIIPEGVTTIGNSAFQNCTSLKSITIPASVIEIGFSAFQDCESLTTITFSPNSQLNIIGDSAFYDCTSLKSITLPASLIEIGIYAFYFCESLTNLIIPEGVTTIGDSAFQYCTSLESITLPASLTIINSVFQDCTNLTTVTFASNSQLTAIGSVAFSNCTSLESITIPASVIEIGYSAFSGCEILTTVTFAQNSQLETIYHGAFGYCISLESIIFPTKVTEIGRYLFTHCNNLTSITFLSATPPDISNDTFYINSLPLQPLPNLQFIRVPAGSVDAYNTQWSSRLSLYPNTLIVAIP